MNSWQIQGGWGIDSLSLVAREDRPLGPTDVRLVMRAASLNYRDLLMVKGLYNPRQPLPLVPFSDGVGEVVEVGERVDRVSVGERVCPTFCQRWVSGAPTRERLRSTLGGPLDGVLSRRLELDQEGVVKVPTYLTDAAAATLPCAALTAWSALVTEARLSAGDWVLLQGTGGVSIFALQFAKVMGLNAILTSSSDAKLERAKALGADVTINYRTDPNWGRTAAKAAGDGVDLVVEVGGAGTLKQSLSAVRMGGQVSLIGVLAGGAPDLNITPVTMQQVRLQGILVGHRDGFEAMLRACATHRLEPVVDQVFGFDAVPDALRALEQAAHFGKIVVAFQ
ncbi:MAG: NAD(P)-dependent alcohol dehydrogenase [Deltaproteobacteria bacterium CG_4_9_14_3_um_filter_63_12]|nr:MAG: NAD(P)-dependent alcohol dehydrogenase [Deltaproteobacteria bacterium CG_4_9_14_3_um_filter_63_12]